MGKKGSANGVNSAAAASASGSYGVEHALKKERMLLRKKDQEVVALRVQLAQMSDDVEEKRELIGEFLSHLFAQHRLPYWLIASVFSQSP